MRAKTSSVLLALIVLAMAVYAAFAVRDYAAYRHSASESIEGFAAASRLQPENADYWRALGAHQLFSSPDTEAALQGARRAAELNPWSARSWLLLASIHQVAGNAVAQQQALTAAINADPRTPDVAWEVANFFLVRGESAQALPLFRPVIENDPQRASAAFTLCWRATHDVEAILRETTPPTPDAHLQLLGVLAGNNELDAATEVWSRIIKMGHAVDAPGAYQYFDSLISNRKISEAKQVSADIESLSSVSYPRREGNLIVNGDFEQRVSNRGFDWRYAAVTGANLTIDYSERRTGTQSLMVQFAGHPADLGLFQYVPVTPGARYEISASVKWQDIQTSSGPRIGVVDPYTGQEYAVTEDLLESGVWRDISAAFTAPPDTRLVVVKVLRNPASPVIKGTLWVDDVRMTQQ